MCGDVDPDKGLDAPSIVLFPNFGKGYSEDNEWSH